MSLSYNYPPQMAYPSAPPVYRSFPAPPRLHWGIVFALSVITLGLFGRVWMLVQANWVKKVTHDSRPFAWCLAHVIALAAIFMIAFAGGLVASLTAGSEAVNELIRVLVPVTQLVSVILYLVAAFMLKGALESQPIDIPLGAVMTFFFAPIYFQYHLFDYSVEGKVAEQLSGFGEPVIAPVAELPPQ
jgi:hypothetical protein